MELFVNFHVEYNDATHPVYTCCFFCCVISSVKYGKPNMYASTYIVAKCTIKIYTHIYIYIHRAMHHIIYLYIDIISVIPINTYIHGVHNPLILHIELYMTY